MNFCSSCGARVDVLTPEGDNRPRYVCIECKTIHYQNPNMVTGCIPEWEGKILLCKRSIEPRIGLWTLPAGFMENGESNMQGAAREAREEANADMRELKLFSVFSIPHINQVYTMYRGILHQGKASAGDESEDVRLVTRQEMPWKQIAFPVIHETLKLYYADIERGVFSTHYGEIIKHADSSIEVKHY